MKNRIMSEKEYVKDRGVPYASIYPVRCPVCRSVDTGGGMVEINAVFATREMYCDECNSRWEDDYSLSGYSSLKPGKS